MTEPSGAKPGSAVASATPAADSPRAARLIGTVVSGRYRLEAIVSESVTGTLFRAEHTHMHKRIALKLLHPESASRPAVLARFEREAIAGAHVDHPNVALAKDFGTIDDGSRFLVMEYLEGETLRAAIQRGPMPIPRVLRIARQIALALDAAHAKGMVHRAVIPQNVYLVQRGGETDVVKLVDFGSAMLPPELVVSQPDAEGVASRVATPFDPVPALAAYAAPEVAAGKNIDARADLYSLGVVMWEMIAGKRPLLSRGQPPPSLRPAHPVTAALDALVRQLLAERQEERLARAIDVVDVLDDELAAAAASRRASSASLPAVESAALGATILSSARPVLAQALDRKAMTQLARRAATSLGIKKPSWYDELPRPIRIGIWGAAAIVVVIVGAIALRPSTAADALLAAELTPVASAGATSAARSGGGTRPTASAHSDEPGFKLPDLTGGDDERAAMDARALADRFQREVQTRQLKGAVTTLDYLLKADPKAAEDRETRSALVKLSQRVTQVQGDTPDIFFEIVATRMGSLGADVLFEIVTTKGASEAADRASKLLRDPALRERATPALRIAYDMRNARSCKERMAMIDRVRDDGDGRCMRALLEVSEECGRRSDCCSRDDPTLKAAIDAVQERSRR